MILRLLVAAVCVALVTGSVAQADIVLDPEVHPEHYGVHINDVSTDADALVYLGDDGTIYVSAADIDEWHLKRPLESKFTRDDERYYGLQTDLHLAAAVDRSTKALEIVAPRSAFVGEPNVTQPALTPGSGAYLNYQLQREFGDYDFFAAQPSGVFEMRYLSTAGEAGLEFHRARTRWFHLDPKGHYVVQAGDWSTGSDDLQDSIPFAGLHVASDFSGDPAFVTHERPSVRGIATAPSLVEVYIDNILQLRQEVLEGPFTIDDLPAEAANSDVILVLTDPAGHKTMQSVRPTVDPSFLGAGLTTFAFDAGVAHERSEQLGSYYRGSVFSGSLRYGITNDITGTFAEQSTVAKTFGDIGVDVHLGDDQVLTLRTGDGSNRHASTLKYQLASGKFRFSEQYTLNSEQQLPLADLEPFDVIAQIRESTSVQVSFSQALSFSLGLDRSRDSTGSDASLISGRLWFQGGPWSVELRPLYDAKTGRFYGGFSVSRSLASGQRVVQRGDHSSRNVNSGALEYAKSRTSPDDPIQLDAKLGIGNDQDERLFVSDEAPAFTASVRLQQLNGVKLVEPQLNGALAFVGNGVYALPAIGDSRTFGVLHVPGTSNVPVSVNGQSAGTTNRSGDLLLRDLAPFRQNIVKVSTSALPIGTTISDPERVAPYQYTPVSLTIPVIARGGFVVTVTDPAGKPLDPASFLRGAAGATYPVGYAGRVYVPGLAAGTQRLTGTAGGAACAVDLAVPADTTAIPDLGTAICR